MPSLAKVGEPARRKWWAERDDEGYRTYHIQWLVKSPGYGYGPAYAMFAPGLPAIGSTWSFGDDLADPWAWCRPQCKVQQHQFEEEKNLFWLVEQTFSNKPLKRCQNSSVENPVAEPAKISGSFVRFQEKCERDRNGMLILSSSHEVVTGIEKDANRPTVSIEINSYTLGIDQFSQMIDCVSDNGMWGLPARCVKLSNVTWSRNVYGTCSYYYTRKFDFEVKYDTWDYKHVADKGFKVFDQDRFDNDEDAPSEEDARADPTWYKLAVDKQGNGPPVAVALDGNGNQLTDMLNPVFLPTVEVYPEADLYSLGIPMNL